MIIVLVYFKDQSHPGKQRKQIENDDEKQKKKQEYEKYHPDRKFSSKWQTELTNPKGLTLVILAKQSMRLVISLVVWVKWAQWLQRS
jgi:hypothetical protein